MCVCVCVCVCLCACVLEALQEHRKKDLGSLFLAKQLEVDDPAPCCLAEQLRIGVNRSTYGLSD